LWYHHLDLAYYGIITNHIRTARALAASIFRNPPGGTHVAYFYIDVRVLVVHTVLGRNFHHSF
jgi:hypothetical protein